MKRTLALFLSIVLCFSLLPVSALAEGEETIDARPEESAEKVLGDALNGLVFDGTTWLYYTNGRIDYDYAGLAYREDIGWWYVKNGTINFDFNGVGYAEGVGYWYCKGGTIDFSFTGFTRYSSRTYYVEGGRVMVDYTGLAYDESAGWRYVENGVVNGSYTGLAYREGVGWWYVKNGAIDFDFTGVGHADGVGYWYCRNGTIDFSFTGFARYSSRTYYVEGGRVMVDYTGLAYEEGVGWRYVENGVLNKSYTGLAYREGVGWWYVQNGSIDFDYTGIGFAEGVGYWYCRNGTIDFDFTGFTRYSGRSYYVQGGRLMVDCSGLVYVEGVGWRYLQNGSVDTAFAGLAYREDIGWWYVKNGTIDFDFTGVAFTEGVGYWYCEDGTINFGYTGYYEDAELGWVYIVGGEVQPDYTPEFPTITPGTTTATIRTGGQKIRYSFTPAESGRYTFSSSGSKDTYVSLYDASNTLLSYDDDSGEDRNFKLTYEFTAGSVYYFEVRFYSSSATGSFDLLLVQEIPTISVGTTTAVIRTGGEKVRYRFTPQSSGSYTLTSTGSGDTYATLYDSSNNVLSYNDDGGEGRNFKLTYELTAGRVYYYEVRFYSSSATGSINLVLSKDGSSGGGQYRALLIGNNNYSSNPLQGCVNDMNAMAAMLSGLGNSFECTTAPNVTVPQMKSAITSAFAGATSSSVSLFFYSGHGLTDGSSEGTGVNNGALVGIDHSYFYMRDLAAELSNVPGRVIVLLDSCRSGAAIAKGAGDEQAANEAFNQSVIDAFAAYDAYIVAGDAKYGELATSKFIVISGCKARENSIEGVYDGSRVGVFTFYLIQGCGCTYGSGVCSGSMPADTNSDGKLTVSEIYTYTRDRVNGFDSSQTPQYYASNPSEVLFRR